MNINELPYLERWKNVGNILCNELNESFAKCEGVHDAEVIAKKRNADIELIFNWIASQK